MAFILKQLTAEQVKQMPAGSIVLLHGRDRFGIHTQLECTIVQSGKSKKLSYRNTDGLTTLRPIRNYPNKFYTEGCCKW